MSSGPYGPIFIGSKFILVHRNEQIVSKFVFNKGNLVNRIWIRIKKYCKPKVGVGYGLSASITKSWCDDGFGRFYPTLDLHVYITRCHN